MDATNLNVHRPKKEIVLGDWKKAANMGGGRGGGRTTRKRGLCEVMNLRRKYHTLRSNLKKAWVNKRKRRRSTEV